VKRFIELAGAAILLSACAAEAGEPEPAIEEQEQSFAIGARGDDRPDPEAPPIDPRARLEYCTWRLRVPGCPGIYMGFGGRHGYGMIGGRAGDGVRARCTGRGCY